MEGVGAREGAPRTARKRAWDLPGHICPRCGEWYITLEVYRRGDREYLYAVHDTWHGGERTRRKCYLGPLNGYRQETSAQTEFFWFWAPPFSADPRARFRTYLGYLGNIAQAAISTATDAEDLGEVLQLLVGAQNAAIRWLKSQIAVAPPADRPADAAAGGGT